MPEGEIGYCHACGVAMDISAVEPFTNVECPTCAKHTRVKREFGAYTLTRRHAIGGMSVVFIAEDNTLDREVIVKLLNKEYSADEKRIGAFEEEARITASISHPNVVRVFTTGRGFGRFYIAMEYVTGGHFEHHIRERGNIPETEALQLAIEVAEGLKAAHHAGLIHRDIKPGNILIESGGGAKIVDFGLALVTQGGKAKAAEIWATPYYVPPETIEGEEEDFRSDIYAFGATFYHAMAGRPSCNEETMDTNRLRLAKRDVTPLGKAAAWLHPDTCAVIDRCMSYEPAGRFRSYEDLISALLDAKEVSVNYVPPPVTTAVPVKGLKGASAMGIGAKFALAAAIVLVVAAAVFAVKTVLDVKVPDVDGSVVGVEDPSSSGGTGNPGGSNPGGVEVGRLYAEASSALKRGDYALARQRFGEVRDHPRVLEPTGSWAACEAVVAGYLEGQVGRARVEANRAMQHLKRANGLKGGTFTRMETGLLALKKWEPIRPVDADDHSQISCLMSLLGGLKNWEQGMLGRAEPHFRHLANAPSDGGQAWVATYIPIAEGYLSDLAKLREVEPASFDLAPKRCRVLIKDLEKVHSGLKTQGRARFNVRCWQLELERRARGMGGRKVAGPDQLEELFQACRFSEADEILRAWQPKDENLQKRRESLVLLNQASIAFLTELGERAGQSPGAGPVKGRDGTIFPKVSGGDARGLDLIGEDDSTHRLGWPELNPESLIDLHRELVKDLQGEVEPLRRYELAIAFGLLAGDEDRAKAAGEKLAGLSDAFRRRWELIAPVLD